MSELIPFNPTRAKIALLFGMFVAGIGNSFVFAILPPVGREMGLTEVQISTVVTVSAMVFMFAAPIWGGKSETWGRRPVLITAYFTYVVMTICFALSIHLGLTGALPLMGALGLMILFRACFTAGISGIFPASQAYMADLTDMQSRTAGMALIGMAIGTGMIAGPAIAAAFAGISLVMPFYAVAGLAAVAAAGVIGNIRELPQQTHEGELKPLRIADRRILPLLFISACMMMTLTTMQQASGFYFQDKFGLSADVTAQRVGLGLMICAIASVTSQMVIARLLNWPPNRLMKVSVPLMMCGMTLLLVGDAYFALVAGLGVFGLGMGMMMPGTIASLSMHAGPRGQGSVAGVNSSAQGLGFMAGPMTAGALYNVHPLLPYGVSLGVLSLIALDVYCIVEFPAILHYEKIPSPPIEAGEDGLVQVESRTS